MVRRTAFLLSLALAAAGALLLGATTSPASADDGPVIAGTFNGRLALTKTWVPGGWGAKAGPRMLSFGQGCALSQACSIDSSTSSSAVNVKPQGGGFGWGDTVPIGCVDNATGALKTNHGFDYTLKVHMVPVATTTRDGVTYVTRLRGTYDGRLAVNGEGRTFDCLVNPRRVPSETEHGVYTLDLAPLPAPKSLTTSPPVALPPAATRAVTTTIPSFRLPQSKEQRDSAVAVAAGRLSSVPGALVPPSVALKSVGSRLPQDLLLVAVLGLLIIFPAQLFNSTYESNHERIDRGLSRLRFWRRRPTVSTSTVGAIPAQARGGPAPPPQPGHASKGRRLSIFFGCVVAGTLLAGFLDPRFGANTASYALVIGVFVSVVVTVLIVALAGRLYRSASHHEKGWYLEAIPSALLIAVVCVVVSRLTHFQPGYLYGVIGGAVFVAALDKRSEGRAEITVGVVALVLAVGSWIAFEPVSKSAASADASTLTLSLDALLACLFIGGLEGMLFGLIPLRFLPGARIKNWSWIAWGLLSALVTYIFVHVLLMPESGYLGRSTAASVTTTIVLFAAFAVTSVLFWGYFRWKPTPEEPAGETAAVSTDSGDEVPATSPIAAAEPPDPSRVPVNSQGGTVPGSTPQVPQQPHGSPAGDQS